MLFYFAFETFFAVFFSSLTILLCSVSHCCASILFCAVTFKHTYKKLTGIRNKKPSYIAETKNQHNIKIDEGKKREPKNATNRKKI